MIGIGTGLVIVGGALEIIANCMSKFGGMRWEEIGRGLTVMGGALAELAISLNFIERYAWWISIVGCVRSLSCSCAGTQYFGSVIVGSDCERTYFYCRSIPQLSGVAGAGTYTIGSDYSGIIRAFALIGVRVLTIGAGLLRSWVQDFRHLLSDSQRWQLLVPLERLQS